MTFKHVKFEDSPTMRALEKVAREKGLVKSELPIRKEAQTEAQRVSGQQLIQNIEQAIANVDGVYSIVQTAGGLTDIVLNWVNDRSQIVRNLKSKGWRVSSNEIDDAISAIEAIRRNLHPSMLHNYLPNLLTSGVSQDVIWNKIHPLLNGAVQALKMAKNLVTTIALEVPTVSKAALQPSDNLMENILKLCNGLREKGFVKEASELETNYLNYKQAQTLYEAHKEKGEDLIHAAHPEGSHKMENVEGDEAVFEDILDQHMKHVQMIEKTPTGKLSEASKVINAVKLVLGQQEFAEEEEHAKKAKPIVKDAVNYFNKICNSLVQNVEDEWMFIPFYQASNWGTAHASTHIDALKDAVQSAYDTYTKTPTITSLQEIRKFMLVLRDSVIDRYSSLSSSKKSGYKQSVNNALEKLDDAKTALTTGEVPEGYTGETEDKPKGLRQGVTVVMNNEGKQFIYQANTYLNQMSGWSAAIDGDPETTPDEKSKAKAWVSDRMGALTKLRDEFNSIQDPNEQNNKAAGYLADLQRRSAEYEKFKSTWI